MTSIQGITPRSSFEFMNIRDRHGLSYYMSLKLKQPDRPVLFYKLVSQKIV